MRTYRTAVVCSLLRNKRQSDEESRRRGEAKEERRKGSEGREREGETHTGSYFRRAVPERATSPRQPARPIDRVCTCVAYLRVCTSVPGKPYRRQPCSLHFCRRTFCYSHALPPRVFGRRKEDRRFSSWLVDLSLSCKVSLGQMDFSSNWRLPIGIPLSDCFRSRSWTLNYYLTRVRVTLVFFRGHFTDRSRRVRTLTRSIFSVVFFVEFEEKREVYTCV